MGTTTKHTETRIKEPVLDPEKLNEAIAMAVAIGKETHMEICVVERQDGKGSLLEYAVADQGVALGINERVAWVMSR